MPSRALNQAAKSREKVWEGKIICSIDCFLFWVISDPLCTNFYSVLSAVRAKVVTELLRTLDTFVMARTNSIVRVLLPSVNDYLLPAGASLMLDFNLTAHKTLVSGRSSNLKLKDVSPLLAAEGDSIPSGTRVIPTHENDLWYVFFRFACSRVNHTRTCVLHTILQDETDIYERHFCHGSPGELINGITR